MCTEDGFKRYLGSECETGCVAWGRGGESQMTPRSLPGVIE